MPAQLFTYHTTITGHEHIYDPVKYIHPLQTIC